MRAFYNEIDAYCCAWLSNLMDAGHIAPGVICDKSIEDITPDELAGYTQCHFFAGIGVWSLALRAAGWPDSRRAWTGSCPCQPFSAAGKGAGFADERHLWPAWQHLINQCRPAVVFGEQVASKAVDAWIDLVHADMEGMGYAFGGVAFPSAGVGAPHIRDRTFWVGDADGARLERYAGHGGAAGWQGSGGSVAATGVSVRVADADMPEQDGCWTPSGQQPIRHGNGESGQGNGTGPVNGFWRNADWISCTDGKWRAVEPGTFPLADGIAGRMGKLRAYGNAINAQAAQAFIESYCEARGLIGLAVAA